MIPQLLQFGSAQPPLRGAIGVATGARFPAVLFRWK